MQIVPFRPSSARQALIGLSAALLLTVSGQSAATAAVPTSIPVEGVLLSSGGGAAADGFYDVTFAIYSDATSSNPLWVEGPAKIGVKSGQFSYILGTSKALSAAILNGTGLHLGMQVATDPELPRKPLSSVAFAVRAAVADAIECSGCVGASNIDPQVMAAYAKTSDLAAYAKTSDLGAYAKTASLAKVATSGAFADLTGGPDLSGYAKSSDLSAYAKAAALAKVAGTGAYADLSGTPDLTGYAKSADLSAYVKAASLAAVAGSGSYADLTNKPVIPALNKTCGTGLVMNGINADGSHSCIASAIAPDMIDEISNGLIWDQFVDSTSGTPSVKIPDGLGAGTTDTLTFPDIGIAQKIWVNMVIANSDMSGVRVELYGPGISTPYVLYNGGKTGTALTTNFNTDTAIVSGDINKDWVGQNIKGAWSITVKDLKAGGGSGSPVTDGTFSWSMNIQTLSSKKIQIKGNLIVDGTVTQGGTVASMGAGTIYRRVCSWGWQSNGDWPVSQSQCTPAACSSGETDLGVQQLTRSAVSGYDPWCCWHASSCGTSERLCLIPPTKPTTVYTTQCQWVNSCYNCDNASSLVTSCTPPACATGHKDFGTQNVWNSIDTNTMYPQAHDASAVSGWSERICVIQ